MITDLAPEKGVEAKKQAPSNQAQQKPNSKAVQFVGYRAELLNLRTACKFTLPQLIEGVADQAAAAERQKKKKHYPATWQDYNTVSAQIPHQD
jgi:hypothetical protein